MVLAYDMDMKQTFLKGNDDILWLRKTHLPENAPIFRYAILHGNEDCPYKVELYKHNHRDETPSVYIRDGNDMLVMFQNGQKVTP
jgi:hypothetical protein